MKRYTPLFYLLLAAGCMSAGVKVDQAKLSEFKKGKTTYSDVIGTLGEPTQTMITDNGDKNIYYSYISSQPRPESFIPYIGFAVGGADMETSQVAMTFDRRDILRSYTTTNGGMGAGTGFEAYSQPRKSQQPTQVQ